MLAHAELGFTGTKLGCGEGGCGACTVMVSRKQAPGATVQHMAVNACLCPLYAVIGCHVITVEGIGSVRDGLHPVQVCACGVECSEPPPPNVCARRHVKHLRCRLSC